MKSLFERLRTRRLASIFRAVIIVRPRLWPDRLPRTVSAARNSTSDSSVATPLKVINSATPPNDFVRIAKLVGPAVVNINTQTLPKQSSNRDGNGRNPHFRVQPNPQNPGGGGDN